MGYTFFRSNLTDTPALKIIEVLKISALEVAQKLLILFHGMKVSQFFQRQEFPALHERSDAFSMFCSKKCLLHLELKMLDCGGIATSGSSLWRLIL